MKNYLIVGARWSLRSTAVMRKYLSFQEAIRLAGGNTGNLLIGEAVHHHLMNLRHPASAVFNRLPVLLGMQSEQLSSVYDAVVIASSNFVNPKTELKPFADLIESLDIPVIIIGVGAELDDDGRIGKLSDGSERFLSLIKERCKLIGVRGEATAEYLASRGITNTQIIGCPSYYMCGVNGPDLRESPIPTNAKVAVSITRDRAVYESHKKLKPVQQQLARYALQNPESAYFVQTNFAEASMSYNGEPEARHLLNMQQYFGLTPEQTEKLLQQARIHFNTSDWAQEIKSFDAAIGTRFHGNMLALQNGVPALWISHDRRTREMCNFLGLPNLHISELDGGQIDISKLLQTIDYSSFMETYQLRYQAFRQFMASNGLVLRD